MYTERRNDSGQPAGGGRVFPATPCQRRLRQRSQSVRRWLLVTRHSANANTTTPCVNGQPTLSSIAYALDDELFQASVFREFEEAVAPGWRLVFHEGGHNLQKTHARLLSRKLREWITLVEGGGKELKP